MTNSAKKLTAIIAVDGKQLKFGEGEAVFLDKRSEAVGQNITLDRVLMLMDEAGIKLGSEVKNSYVKAKVMDTVKDDKLVVFKKKRRKGYKKTQGHRQSYTQVLIEQIVTE